MDSETMNKAFFLSVTLFFTRYTAGFAFKYTATAYGTVSVTRAISAAVARSPAQSTLRLLR